MGGRVSRTLLGLENLGFRGSSLYSMYVKNRYMCSEDDWHVRAGVGIVSTCEVSCIAWNDICRSIAEA